MGLAIEDTDSRFVFKFLLYGLLIYYVLSASTQGCQLQPHWTGHFFDLRYKAAVHIQSSAISRRGTCISRVNDNIYLFKHRNCYHCMAIFDRHKNLLVYKETVQCNIPPETVTCSSKSFDPNLVLNQFVRDPVEPVPCPEVFSRPYGFTYDNGSGTCQSARNYWNTCPHPGHLHFSFGACVDVYDTYDSESNFICIATWKFDGGLWIFGKFSSSEIKDKAKMYKCLQYNRQRQLLVGVSGKASCRDVKDIDSAPVWISAAPSAHWPQTNCEFPSWFGRQLFSLSSGRPLHWSPNSKQLLLSPSRSNTSSSLSCIHSGATRKHWEEQVVQRTSGCGIYSYQCFRSRQHHGNRPVEVQWSTDSSSNSYKDACEDRSWTQAVSTHLLFDPSVLEGSASCPFVGQYVLSSASACNKQPIATSGCVADDVISFPSTCGEQNTEYRCLLTWKHHESIYLLTQHINSSLLQCLSMERLGSTVIVHWLQDCSLQSEASPSSPGQLLPVTLEETGPCTVPRSNERTVPQSNEHTFNEDTATHATSDAWPLTASWTFFLLWQSLMFTL